MGDGKDGGIEVFTCTLKNASDNCVWYRNNKKIESANFSILKYECVAEGAQRKLIVKNIRRQDVGEYVCICGDSKVTIKLTVGARTTSGAQLKDWQGVRNSWQGLLWQEQMHIPA